MEKRNTDLELSMALFKKAASEFKDHSDSRHATDLRFQMIRLWGEIYSCMLSNRAPARHIDMFRDRLREIRGLVFGRPEFAELLKYNDHYLSLIAIFQQEGEEAVSAHIHLLLNP